MYSWSGIESLVAIVSALAMQALICKMYRIRQPLTYLYNLYPEYCQCYGELKTTLYLWFWFVKKLIGQVVDSQWLYLFVGHFLIIIIIMNNIILLITQGRFSIAQASSSFKCLDTCTFMNATPTFMTKMLCLVNYV